MIFGAAIKTDFGKYSYTTTYLIWLRLYGTVYPLRKLSACWRICWLCCKISSPNLALLIFWNLHVKNAQKKWKAKPKLEIGSQIKLMLSLRCWCTHALWVIGCSGGILYRSEMYYNNILLDSFTDITFLAMVFTDQLQFWCLRKHLVSITVVFRNGASYALA